MERYFASLQTFLVMPKRIAKIIPYEFGEVLQVSVLDIKIKKPIMVIRVPLEALSNEFFHYSVTATKGVVPNLVAKEIFLLTNFLDDKDWINRLSEYDDFCDCKL